MVKTYLLHLTKEVAMAQAKAGFLFMCVLLLTSCSTGSIAQKKTADPGTHAMRNGCHGRTFKDPALNLPGCYAVSTMEPGKEFDTQVNFAYFKACGRPCWLPIYSHPALVKGMTITKGHPCEYYLPSTKSGYCASKNLPPDAISVVCQVHGKLPPGVTGDTTITDDSGHSSDIWDEIIVPIDDMVGDKTGLKPSQDGEGYLAYGSDLWLENTGWHNIPCK